MIYNLCLANRYLYEVFTPELYKDIVVEISTRDQKQTSHGMEYIATTFLMHPATTVSNLQNWKWKAGKETPIHEVKTRNLEHASSLTVTTCVNCDFDRGNCGLLPLPLTPNIVLLDFGR